MSNKEDRENRGLNENADEESSASPDVQETPGSWMLRRMQEFCEEAGIPFRDMSHEAAGKSSIRISTGRPTDSQEQD